MKTNYLIKATLLASITFSPIACTIIKKRNLCDRINAALCCIPNLLTSSRTNNIMKYSKDSDDESPMHEPTRTLEEEKQALVKIISILNEPNNNASQSDSDDSDYVFIPR